MSAPVISDLRPLEATFQRAEQTRVKAAEAERAA